MSRAKFEGMFFIYLLSNWHVCFCLPVKTSTDNKTTLKEKQKEKKERKWKILLSESLKWG